MGQHGQELVLAAVGGGQLVDALVRAASSCLRTVMSSMASRISELRPLLEQPPGVEQQGLPADVLELLLHLVAFQAVVLGQDLLQEPAQLGDVPLAVAEVVEEAGPPSPRASTWKVR